MRGVVGRASQVGMSTFLSVSLTPRVSPGDQHRARVSAGAKLIRVGSPGAGMVCGGPTDPRPQECRQRPKPGWITGPAGALLWALRLARA